MFVFIIGFITCNKAILLDQNCFKPLNFRRVMLPILCRTTRHNLSVTAHVKLVYLSFIFLQRYLMHHVGAIQI